MKLKQFFKRLDEIKHYYDWYLENDEAIRCRPCGWEYGNRQCPITAVAKTSLRDKMLIGIYDAFDVDIAAPRLGVEDYVCLIVGAADNKENLSIKEKIVRTRLLTILGLT